LKVFPLPYVLNMEMRLKVELEREEDGSWLAEVPELPGVLAYGRTRDTALVNAEAHALQVLADRLEHGDFEGLDPEAMTIVFIPAGEPP
jgi:predicted RNase H-like HicB family nuclease